MEERIRGTQGAHLQSENEINRLTHENKLLKVELEGIKVSFYFVNFIEVLYIGVH